MADENFILTLEGKLDEKKTAENVKSILKKINNSINDGNLNNGLKIFDKAQLDRDGKLYIQGLSDIKKQIAEILKVNEGDVQVSSIFNDKGAIEALTAKINGLTEAFSRLNLVRVSFTDGGQGFVSTNADLTNLNAQVNQINQSMKNTQAPIMTENLNNLSSGVKSTSDELSRLATELRNAENFKSPEGIGSLLAKQSYKDIDQFRNQYKALVGDMEGVYKATIKLNGAGQQTGFTAEITSATGAVEKLNFELEKNVGYVYKGGNINDNTFVQQAESILKVEKTLEDFQRKLKDGVSFKFIDPNTLERVEKLKLLLADLRLGVGSNNQTDITKANTELQNIITTANEYNTNQKKIQVESEKTTAKINSQNLELEKQRVLLENYNNTKLNPNNAAFVGNSDKLNDVRNQLYDIARIRDSLAQRNQAGQILDPREIDAVNIKIKELRNSLEDARRAATQTFEGNESAERIAVGIATATSKLQSYVPMWEKMGVYTGDFKAKVEGVFQSINKAQNSLDLSNINKQITQLGNNARQISREMANTRAIDQLNQKVGLLKQQLIIFEQANPRAARIYATQFEELKKSLDTVANNNDLKKLQTDFKSLQLASKQIGVEGKTMGQRLSDAFKKVLMLGGITSLMMYTTKAIRDIIQNVKDLDKAMVLLQRVTNESDATYKQMFNNAIKNAKELNTTVLDLIQSTAELSKLGFEPKTAETLAQIINMMNRVADIDDISKSTEYMVSIINGFKDLSADDAMNIVDVLDNINNKYSISAEGIAEALKRSSASLSEANNTLEESVALITASNSVLQDTAKVGRYCQR